MGNNNNNNNNNSAFGNIGAGAPWGNNNNDHGNNNNNDNSDAVINDRNRFNINNLVGTWAISADGVAERPWIDQKGDVQANPSFDTAAAVRDINVAFVGLLCIDHRGKCSLEILVSTAEESFIRESFGDSNCVVEVNGNGQGFVKASLSSTAGCDTRGVFPNTLILQFVVGENGEGFFDVQGCPFGLENKPSKTYKSAADAAASAYNTDDSNRDHGKFECDMAEGGEVGNGLEDTLTPIVMNGEMERQNARQFDQNHDKHGQQLGNGPWGGSWGSNGNGNDNNNGYNDGSNNNDHGNNNNDNEASNLANHQDACERFDAFDLPFKLRPATQTSNGYLPGCDEKLSNCRGEKSGY